MICIGFKVSLTTAFFVLCLVAATIAVPWGMHQSNYDASLDPIVWSRGFVKDSIRRPRLYRSNVHDEPEEMPDNLQKTSKKSKALQSNSYDLHGRRAYARTNADNFNTYYNGESSLRKYNSMRRRFYRRPQKLDSRDRYDFV
ncbi:uncharacterized protein LOC101887570 [Musca domestica]|uniref:Uncharacterized protein LOC101887570 n=1 Tax=Musca domestica TaxID=7370 RepID=A0A9J7CR06_MUSDO|nr:uncharacterized protein LOC101887570 [Musca domestica]